MATQPADDLSGPELYSGDLGARRSEATQENY
jgi:hypothetical protein